MNYKPVYLEYDFKEIIIINWSPPFSLETLGSKKNERIVNHQKAYFYKLLGKRNNKFDLFYIGQTQSQFVSQRLINDDHQKKQQRFKKDHPKHSYTFRLAL